MCSHALSTLNCVGAGARFKWWEWSVGSAGSVGGWGPYHHCPEYVPRRAVSAEPGMRWKAAPLVP